MQIVFFRSIDLSGRFVPEFSAGFDLSDIVRVQYTITNRTLAPECTEVFGSYLADIRPAATMVIADLMEPEMLVEVEVTAFKG